MEPDQLSVELELARLQIFLGDCSKADSSAVQLNQSIPYLESIQLLAAQTAICQGQFERATQLRQAIELKKSPLAVFWSSADADLALRSSQPQKALDAA